MIYTLEILDFISLKNSILKTLTFKSIFSISVLEKNDTIFRGFLR